MTNELKLFRTQNGMTQSDLAKAVGVSRQTVISIESNKYSPSVILALKFANILGAKVEDIFKLEETD